MPANYIKSFAEQSGKDVKEVERLYKEAKKIVEKEYNKTEKDGEPFYQLVTGVLKKMLKISTSDALCGGCGADVSLNDAYCSSCGSQLMDAPGGGGAFLRISELKPGKKYLARDLAGDENKFEKVTVVSVKKVGSTDYDIVVKYEDGTDDKWYLENTDKVFKNI